MRPAPFFVSGPGCSLLRCRPVRPLRFRFCASGAVWSVCCPFLRHVRYRLLVLSRCASGSAPSSQFRLSLTLGFSCRPPAAYCPCRPPLPCAVWFFGFASVSFFRVRPVVIMEVCVLFRLQIWFAAMLSGMSLSRLRCSVCAIPVLSAGPAVAVL